MYQGCRVGATRNVHHATLGTVAIEPSFFNNDTVSVQLVVSKTGFQLFDIRVRNLSGE